MNCQICGAAMVPDRAPDTFRCPNCGYLASALPVRINAVERIEEDVRERALKPIRAANFRQLLDECGDLLQGRRLLDVGCAHGWFMEAASSRGIACDGIEPDREMAQRAAAAGHRVMTGFFPDDLPEGARYGAITFNDVFEHLPMIQDMARALPRFLEAGGLVIVNLPVADGAIFRLTRIAARLGVRQPLDRMWQRGLPSPHLSYFTSRTVRRLFEGAGFSLVRHGALQSLVTDGLYERIRYDREIGTARAVALYGAARAVKLVTGLFPSDIQYFVFRTVG